MLAEVYEEYNVKLVPELNYSIYYSAIILCVCHTDFLSIDYKKFKLNKSIIYDVKGFLPLKTIDFRL